MIIRGTNAPLDCIFYSRLVLILSNYVQLIPLRNSNPDARLVNDTKREEEESDKGADDASLKTPLQAGNVG